MRQGDRSLGVGAILTFVFAVAATGLLGGTLVLGLLGAQSAVMWTGTTGCVFLAGWLLAANGSIHGGAARSREKSRRRAVVERTRHP